MDMVTLMTIIKLVVQNFLLMMLSPIFLIVVAVVYFQYRKINRQKQEVFGIKEKLDWKHTAVAVAHGLVGGLIGSFLIVFLGVSLSGIGIQFLWALAILLMLISPRFICFAYAGGIISLFSIVFGFPQIDVPQLLGLVAILHMVESVLILVSGHLGALPLYTKLDNGQIVGGFNLQKFWPIPLVALAMMVMTDPSQVSGVGMPDWWPLIKPGVEGNPDNFVYTMLPVVAALGYGDLALTSAPREKSKKTAILLGTYSAILLTLAVLSSHYPLLLLLAAVFSPLGHELVIKIGKDIELKGIPKYVHPPEGIMVLEVLNETPAAKMGIKTGDVILTINGYPVNSRQQLIEVVSWGGTALEVDYLDGIHTKYNRVYTRKGFNEDLGIIMVPQGDEPYYAKFSSKGFLGKWWDKIKKQKN